MIKKIEYIVIKEDFFGSLPLSFIIIFPRHLFIYGLEWIKRDKMEGLSIYEKNRIIRKISKFFLIQ